MSQWISVEDRIDMDREDNCCLEAEDVERYGVSVLVFDEDMGAIYVASHDFIKHVWEDSSSGMRLNGITHWMPLPNPPESA